ncbi:hypothetical protein DesfrDRAFT_2517 [Solidesulfovibrio fructosivorans JJ]]|uniref:Uncharacterized protein n=1 Tax=Solidesulfovibrio fructosivorans JJ] TaxID=596151 RepID=E1JY18_SOLFR|nr:hypothetical protein [Solidesulfovibrio fructosivorans]EFL50756.1 hypothetical protein DesfrDRAFT_2517 [Solidesulfovibrio fructosivorans JJ]]
MAFSADARGWVMSGGECGHFGVGVVSGRGGKTGSFLLALLVELALQPPAEALAIQTHGGVEGLYTHQFGHVLFLVAMVVLYFRLRRLVEWTSRGWRLIGASCLLFAMWNAVAFWGHWLEESMSAMPFAGGPTPWSRELVVSSGWKALLFYACKLDHLLSVPAMLLFLLGLRALYKERQ